MEKIGTRPLIKYVEGDNRRCLLVLRLAHPAPGIKPGGRIEMYDY